MPSLRGHKVFYSNTGKSKSAVYFLLAQDKHSALWASAHTHAHSLRAEYTHQFSLIFLVGIEMSIHYTASIPCSVCVCARALAKSPQPLSKRK